MSNEFWDSDLTGFDEIMDSFGKMKMEAERGD